MSNISYKTFLSGLALGLVFAFPALAGEISITDQVAHVEDSGDHGMQISVLMKIDNTGAADRIYAVRSKVAKTGQMAGGIDKRASGHGDHLIATVIDVAAESRTELHEDGHHIQLIDLKRKVEEGER